MKLTVTTAFEEFGRLMTADEVCAEVPLMVILEGPKAGWVYDSRAMSTTPPVEAITGDSLTYEYRNELFRSDDGRLMRGFRESE